MVHLWKEKFGAHNWGERGKKNSFEKGRTRFLLSTIFAPDHLWEEILRKREGNPCCTVSCMWPMAPCRTLGGGEKTTGEKSRVRPIHRWSGTAEQWREDRNRIPVPHLDSEKWCRKGSERVGLFNANSTKVLIPGGGFRRGEGRRQRRWGNVAHL